MLRIHSFESMGTFDGPGLRLVVFLQGCNFQCLYCANPDTIPIGKGGKLIEEAEVLRRAISERPFFGKRGGITFSGGEPTVQAQALIPLCRQLKEEGIHICLDTQGSIRNAYVDELLSIVDMVLLDCKHVLPEGHRRLTTQSNANTFATASSSDRWGSPCACAMCLCQAIAISPRHSMLLESASVAMRISSAWSSCPTIPMVSISMRRLDGSIHWSISMSLPPRK